MKIFLSYARMDEAKVRTLYEKLSDKGFNPWIDIENIFPGEDWEHSIINVIKESHFFLACISRNSVNKRGFIQLEINEALEIWKQKLNTDIYLIPVRLEDCNVPKELEKFQRVDLFARGGFKMLVNALKVGMERLKEEEAKIKESSNMENKRKSPLEFSVEELDRELIARGAQSLGKKEFMFRDKEGSPERDAIMDQVKKLYENPPPPNDALSHISNWDLAKILIFKTRSAMDFSR
jgi:hypothetical protein